MIRLSENKIAVSPIFDPDKSPGGIYIPEQAKDRCDQGIVKYIGPEVKDIKVGDYVLFSGYTGTLVSLEDEGLLIIFREEFVTCRIEPENVVIPGLFFKVKAESYNLMNLIEAVERIAPMVGSQLKEAFIKYEQEKYLPANYEKAVEFVSMAYNANRIRTKDKLENRPKDEYKR